MNFRHLIAASAVALLVSTAANQASATDIRSWLEYFANTILEAPAAKFLLCMGLFSIFWFGQERAAPRGLVVAAFTRLSRAKAGGPGRTRTCNQTVMSGRL